MKFFVSIANGLNKLKDIPPLLFRLLLAAVFYQPFMMKIGDINAFAGFLNKLGVPAPTLSAYLVMITEGLGVILLTLGLATRAISLGLMCVMAGAISLVHWQHGWNPGNNGFALPFIFGLILLSLFLTGPGCISLDGLLARRSRFQR